jgi:hypothetical protein
MVAMKIWYRLSGFRGEDFLEIDQPETRMAYVFKCLICVNIRVNGTELVIYMFDIDNVKIAFHNLTYFSSY